MKINIIVAAAGFSRRFEANKLLYPLQGTPLIEHLLKTLTEVSCHHVYVVTQYKEIACLALSYGFTPITNEHPSLGLSQTIITGLTKMADADGVLFINGDMPYIQSKTINQLLSRADEKHILCAQCGGVLQNPMLFPKCYFEELLTLSGDWGAKKIALNHVEWLRSIVLTSQEAKDIDTIEDL